MGRKPFDYALYKGEELLSIGTIREIAKERGVKQATIEHYRYPSYKKKFKSEDNKRLILIEIDD